MSQTFLKNFEIIVSSLFFHRACCYHTLFKNPTHALYFTIL